VARAARSGVEVALLAADGWQGPAHAVEGPAGLLPAYLRDTGRQPDYDALKQDLTRFEGPLYVYPKFTSCSASIGPFLDALDPIYQREGLKASDVERFVIVREWPAESSFGQKILHFEPPRTIVGAQLNMNYSISLYLHRGSASVYDFTEEALHDESVLDLAARADLEVVPEASDYAIRLVLRDGRTVEAPFHYSRGEKPEPEAYELRMQKFAMLTRDRLSDKARQRVIAMVDTLDKVPDVAAWTVAIHQLLKPIQ